MIELNKIYLEDCLTTLSKIEDNSIDLVVTSPPYNKGFYANKYAKTYGIWGNLDGRKIAYDIYDDEMSPENYEKWQRNILDECIRVLKPSGSIFYNHKDILYKGLTIVPKWVYDYKVKQQIVWYRGGSPMKDPHYFMPSNEWIYWIVKDEKQTYFDKSKAVLKTNVWKMNFEKNPHPAPFPIILSNNCVFSCCPVGGIVYDPFMGSGTTAVSVIIAGGDRKYIGSDISENYIKMAEKRIMENKPDITLF